MYPLNGIESKINFNKNICNSFPLRPQARTVPPARVVGRPGRSTELLECERCRARFPYRATYVAHVLQCV